MFRATLLGFLTMSLVTVGCQKERPPLTPASGVRPAAPEDLGLSDAQISGVLATASSNELQQARIAAGLIPLTGTGIVIQLEDSKEPVPPGGSDADYLVGSRDIRVVVEQLWNAGAEAISVNGERLTTSSAIIDVGSSLLVNSAYLTPPYQVSALGPTDLYAKLSAAAGFVDFVRARGAGYGIQISVAEPESVDIPAFVGTVTLRYSRPVPSASPGLSPGSSNPAGQPSPAASSAGG